MTKRFTLKEYTIGDYAILDDGTEIAYASYKSAFTFCELLNDLHEENQDLKSFNKDLAENLSACANARISKDDLIEKLTIENEQLKLLIKKVLETTPIEHSLAMDLKNSIRELYK